VIVIEDSCWDGNIEVVLQKWRCIGFDGGIRFRSNL
jgi:hypothetical protein